MITTVYKIGNSGPIRTDAEGLTLPGGGVHATARIRVSGAGR